MPWSPYCTWDNKGAHTTRLISYSLLSSVTKTTFCLLYTSHRHRSYKSLYYQKDHQKSIFSLKTIATLELLPQSLTVWYSFSIMRQFLCPIQQKQIETKISCCTTYSQTWFYIFGSHASLLCLLMLNPLKWGFINDSILKHQRLWTSITWYNVSM